MCILLQICILLHCCLCSYHRHRHICIFKCLCMFEYRVTYIYACIHDSACLCAYVHMRCMSVFLCTHIFVCVCVCGWCCVWNGSWPAVLPRSRPSSSDLCSAVHTWSPTTALHAGIFHFLFSLGSPPPTARQVLLYSLLTGDTLTSQWHNPTCQLVASQQRASNILDFFELFDCYFGICFHRYDQFIHTWYKLVSEITTFALYYNINTY